MKLRYGQPHITPMQQRRRPRWLFTLVAISILAACVIVSRVGSHHALVVALAAVASLTLLMRLLKRGA